MYDGKRLIPAPFVTINKDYQATGDGEKVGSLFRIIVAGTIVAFKGSPNTSRVFHTSSGFPADEVVNADARLAAIIRKQEAIRELFSTDGLQFEVQSADGSQPMRCNPRVLSIEFPDELWFNTSTYTVVLEADVLTVNGVAQGEDAFSEFISSASETWSFETQQDLPEGVDLNRTYTLSHTVSAQGKRFYDSANNLQKPAWKQARDYVLPKLGFNIAISLSSGVNNLPTFYNGFNQARSENIGERDGSYSVTETWIMASGSSLETFSVNTRDSLTTGFTSVSVEGNIRGLDARDSNFNLLSNKYDNAVLKFAAASGLAHHRAQTYSGKTLNINALNTTIGRSDVGGTISYSLEYDNRPSNLFSKGRSESVSMGDSFNVDQFASIFILGRSLGPILQPLNTKQANTRTLNIEVLFGAGFADGGTPTNRLITKHPRNDGATLAELNSIVNAAQPVLAGALNNNALPATQAFITAQTENWEPNTGRYSYRTEWTYE